MDVECIERIFQSSQLVHHTADAPKHEKRSYYSSQSQTLIICSIHTEGYPFRQFLDFWQKENEAGHQLDTTHVWKKVVHNRTICL